MKAVINILVFVIVILIINDLLDRRRLNRLQREQTRLNISVLQMEYKNQALLTQRLASQVEQEER